MQPNTRGIVALGFAVALAGCGNRESAPKPKGDEPAGEVVALEGKASAERASQPDRGARALAIGEHVFADDTIATEAGASVTIQIFHNQARWELGGGKRVALARSASWNASKGGSGAGLLASDTDDQTAAAGRHAERQAADTRATAAKLPPAESPRPEETVLAEAEQPRAPKRKRQSRSKSKQESEADGSKRIGDGSIGLGKGSGISIGTGSGKGYGSGAGRLGKRKDRTISLKTAKPTIMGSISREVIKRVVRQNKAQIQYCYAQALQTSEKLAGRLAIKWGITESGAVTDVTVVANETGSESLAKCVAAKIRTWKFPAPEGGGKVVITYPFVFEPPE
jgi:hypothetical protein